MAKKSRRSRRESPKPNAAQRPPVSVNAGASAAYAQPKVSEAAPKRQAQTETAVKKAPDFSQEYHYVISDLKRVGILAAGLLVGLIVLSFVL